MAQNKVHRLKIFNFTAFDDATFEFCPGINVLIGANSTGKTHVLKSIYTILKINRMRLLRSGNGMIDTLSNTILNIFKTNELSDLLRNGKRYKEDEYIRGEIELLFNQQYYGFNIGRRGDVGTSMSPIDAEYPSSLLFLPSQEFLSNYEGFIAAYTNRETSFDETYYDLALALNAKPLRQVDTVESLLKPLKEIIAGKITQENGKFYITLPEGKLESHLVSEGYRKIAMLMYLIRNGSILPGGILLWDEPETNLNPNLVTVVVETLLALARAGVQIFIATHDYLLSQELSLRAEYNVDVPMKFFALHKPNKRAGVEVESGNTLVEIDNNPIVKEFAAHYDREARLFNNTIDQP